MDIKEQDTKLPIWRSGIFSPVGILSTQGPKSYTHRPKKQKQLPVKWLTGHF